MKPDPSKTSFFSLTSLNVASNGSWSYAASNTASDSAIIDITQYDLPYFGSLSSHDQMRISKINYGWAPCLKNLGKPLEQMTACEIGSGIGTVSIPLSRLFKHYYGIDIDKEKIDFSIRNAKAQGRENLEFIHTDVLTYLKEFKKDLEHIDVFVLYAVLEHLTIEERKTLLLELSELLNGRGMLLVAEAPNRLFPFDSHSSQLNFFDLLPQEIALEYYKKSPRNDFIAAIENSNNKINTLLRFGRGVSYHEFELWLPEHWSSSIIADGYDPFISVDNPFTSYEASLNSYFANNGLQLNRSFSRYWIEFFCDFSKKPELRRPSLPKSTVFIIPELIGKGVVSQAKEWWSSPVCVVSRKDSAAFYDVGKFNNESKRITLMFDWNNTKGVVNIEVKFSSYGKVVIPFDFDLLKSIRPKFWHHHGFLTFQSTDKNIRSVSITPDSRSSTFGGNYLLAM